MNYFRTLKVATYSVCNVEHGENTTHQVRMFIPRSQSSENWKLHTHTLACFEPQKISELKRIYSENVEVFLL